MLIDWFTVAAQALNFLVLVWLMKHFLYQPILDAIDAREKGVAAELADADKKKAEAKADRDEFQKKNATFDAQRADMLTKATDEAAKERQRLLDAARSDADAMRAKRADALQREQKGMATELGRRTSEEVFAIARKTLGDLADVSLDARISDVFMRRLRALDDDAKQTFITALKSLKGPAQVRSAFVLTDAQRAALQQALNETFSADIPLSFETSAELVGGIEFTANGQKLAWSIADYLGALQASIGELVKGQAPADDAKDTNKDIDKDAKPATPVVEALK
jgi:F-type H+-transporting ATPase subunit b